MLLTGTQALAEIIVLCSWDILLSRYLFPPRSEYKHTARAPGPYKICSGLSSPPGGGGLGEERGSNTRSHFILLETGLARLFWAAGLREAFT